MAELTPVVKGSSDNRIALQSGDTVAGLTRVLFNDYADVATTGSATVLATNSIAANTFISDGGTLQVQYFGIMASNTNDKALDLTFNSSSIFTQLYNEALQTSWRLDVTIIRESSSAVKCFTTVFVPTLNPVVTYTRLTSLSLTGSAYNLQLTGTPTSSSDITFKFSKGTYTPGI